MRVVILSLVLLFPLVASPKKSAFNASFPCAKARTMIEKTICSHTGLAAADVAMATAYGIKRATLKKVDQVILRTEQKAWLATRLACRLPIIFPAEITDLDPGARRSYRLESLRLETAVQCLIKRYDARTHALTDGSTSLKLEIVQAPEKEVGVGIDQVFTRQTTLRYGAILMEHVVTEDSGLCKNGCDTYTYYVQRGTQKAKVEFSTYFKDTRRTELLTTINTQLKKSFLRLVAEHADCFHEPTYRNRTFEDLALNLSKVGFHFSAESGAHGACQGPAGSLSMTLPFDPVKTWLAPLNTR